MNDVEVGFIKLNVRNISTLNHHVKSSIHNIAELPWELMVVPEQSDETGNLRFLAAYVGCNTLSESTLWNCEAEIDLRVISQQNDNHYVQKFRTKFSISSNDTGFPDFIKWSHLMSPRNGFVTNDSVTIEAKISVFNVNGIRTLPNFDFQENNVNFSDMVLVIEGKKVHVSKVYLSLYSPVFQAMFFSDFKEREEKEIVLDDVYEEFVELVKTIYPCRKNINEKNAEFLLKLADKYQMKFVTIECEKFLMRTREVSAAKKLVLADQYSLAKLQNICIQRIRSKEEMKDIRATNEFSLLSDTTKSALFEKLLKLV